MANLYRVLTKSEVEAKFSQADKVSILYHDLFDFPMTFADLVKWSSHESLYDYANKNFSIVTKRGFSYLRGHEGIIYKKILRERISDKKIEIAKKASRVISFIPTVKMVAVTGSLAMKNASDESDIDLMIITKKGTLWTTRMVVYFLLSLFGIKRRSPNDKDEKDKLCINMWLDESNLTWHDRNIYSAHEIAQIIPLVNKDKTYEKFMYKNKWLLDYWPNAVRVQSTKYKVQSKNFLTSSLESLAFRIQYKYMKSKLTRETVSKTRALFHPQDWGKVVLDRLSS
ncbi:MAG TPA: nucleotidyltransferase domain-containing protein [Patescibacteria group bacterium]|nr:nucleotidyltransferase domain-containing protein [Patescibacteria group bacterium]